MIVWPLIAVLALFAINVPIAIALIGPPLLYFVGQDLPLDLVAQRIVSATESFPLLALPLFMLAGSIMNAAGITRRLLNFAGVFCNHLVGGTAQLTIVLATLLGGLTASANADAAMMSRMLGSSMIRQGYARGFAASLIATASIITAMIPPGIGLIIYAYLANVSVGRLFLAGIVPGLITAAVLMVTVYIVARKRGYRPATTQRATLRDLLGAFWESIWALTLPVFIILGIRAGVFTPTEAGAIAVVYAVIVGVVFHRELGLRHVPGILQETLLTTSVIMIIICGAATFGYYMTWESLPEALASAMVAITDNPLLLLLVINLMLIVIGMVMEATASMILLVPILVPVVVGLGIDPIHFGIIVVLNITIGGVTPPVGTLMFTSSAILKVRYGEFVRESVPFLIASFATLALITLVPQVSLWLPAVLMP